MRRLLRNAEQMHGTAQRRARLVPGSSRDNAIANLILHVAGSLRQRVLGGIGGQSDTRNRPAEFSATQVKSKDELIRIPRETIEDTVT